MYFIQHKEAFLKLQFDEAPLCNEQSTGLIILCFIALIALGMPDGLLGVARPSIRGTFQLPLDALGTLLISSVTGYTMSPGHAMAPCQFWYWDNHRPAFTTLILALVSFGPLKIAVILILGFSIAPMQNGFVSGFLDLFYAQPGNLSDFLYA